MCVCVCVCVCVCNCNSTKRAHYSKIVIRVIDIKSSKFENKAISSLICNNDNFAGACVCTEYYSLSIYMLNITDITMKF